MTANPADQFVVVDDVTLRCRVDGTAGQPWLVFANSLMTDLTLWDDQVAAFGSRFSLLRYDQRGHGGSSVPVAPCTFPRLVDDLVALLDHFDIGAASVVGVSMGGVTALGLAARYPERVSRVAICDCQSASSPAGAAAWDERIALTGAGTMAPLVKPTITRWFLPASLESGMPSADRVRTMIATTPRDGFVRGARALQDYDFSTYPAALHSPALFLVGDGDGALPDAMARMAAAAPGARLAVIPGAGHLPNVEQPARFNAELATLLDTPIRD